MTRIFATIDRTDPTGGYVVRRPRENDATGAALRAAYGDDSLLPADMIALLRAIGRPQH